ncbi:acyl carrier protein [Pseudomonas sp. NPDC086251]|jgi:acyl carrier protein|uniref:acyl carrier protein n=1 Tax=Pseudomonas sp. NPDC086251 TaxID=3364431 RepID=UPI003835FF8D
MQSMQAADLEVEAQVIKALSEYFPVGRRKIERGSRLVEDLYVDSMSIVEIVILLNEEFDVELPAAEVAGWETVDDIVCSVEISQCAGDDVGERTDL